MIQTHKFRAYCHLNNNACVYLLYVPDFEEFSDDAKEALASIAWAKAQEIVRINLKNPPERLALGIQGKKYQRVLIGHSRGTDDDNDDGLRCDCRLSWERGQKKAAAMANSSNPTRRRPPPKAPTRFPRQKLRVRPSPPTSAIIPVTARKMFPTRKPPPNRRHHPATNANEALRLAFSANCDWQPLVSVTGDQYGGARPETSDPLQGCQNRPQRERMA